MKVRIKGSDKELGEVIANKEELFFVKLNTPQYLSNGLLVSVIGIYYSKIEPLEGNFQDGSLEGVEIITE